MTHNRGEFDCVTIAEKKRGESKISFEQAISCGRKKSRPRVSNIACASSHFETLSAAETMRKRWPSQEINLPFQFTSERMEITPKMWISGRKRWIFRDFIEETKLV